MPAGLNHAFALDTQLQRTQLSGSQKDILSNEPLSKFFILTCLLGDFAAKLVHFSRITRIIGMGSSFLRVDKCFASLAVSDW